MSREQKFDLLRGIIERMDGGLVQVTVYRGMPVKIQMVSNEIVLAGEEVWQMLGAGEVEYFYPRRWWTPENESGN